MSQIQKEISMDMSEIWNNAGITVQDCGSHALLHLNKARQGKARQVYLYSTFQHKVIQSALQKWKTF